MPLEALELEDLEKFIYYEIYGSLPERVDYAWSAYINPTIDKKYRLQALQFMIYAFDIKVENLDMPDVLNYELITLMDHPIIMKVSELMHEREQIKAILPNYIPGRAPDRVRQLLLTRQASSLDIIHTQMSDNVLHMNEYGKSKDKQQNAKYLTPTERDYRSVHISNGLFYQYGALFDTNKQQAKEKQGFAGFTLNVAGELSVFTHKYMRDGIAHSSMNSGAPVICAGELQITKGKLIAITTSSGHYAPSLFNVHNLLEYLAKKGVDISKTKVLTFKDPSKTHPIPSQKHRTYSHHFEIDADKIYKDYGQILSQNINNISKNLETIYQDRDKKLLPEWMKPIKNLLREPKAPSLIESRRTFENVVFTTLQWINTELSNQQMTLDDAIDNVGLLIEQVLQTQQSDLYASPKALAVAEQVSTAFTSFKESIETIKQEISEKNNTMDSFKKMS